MKRIIIATLSGLATGFLCNGLACSGSQAIPLVVSIQIIASRTLIGLTIGISRLKMPHWSLHGILIGIIYSIPLAISGLMAPDNPEFSKTAMVVSTIVAGIVYGVLIELVTTVIFKAKAEQ